MAIHTGSVAHAETAATHRMCRKEAEDGTATGHWTALSPPSACSASSQQMSLQLAAAPAGPAGASSSWSTPKPSLSSRQPSCRNWRAQAALVGLDSCATHTWEDGSGAVAVHSAVSLVVYKCVCMRTWLLELSGGVRVMSRGAHMCVVRLRQSPTGKPGCGMSSPLSFIGNVEESHRATLYRGSVCTVRWLVLTHLFPQGFNRSLLPHSSPEHLWLTKSFVTFPTQLSGFC